MFTAEQIETIVYVELGALLRLDAKPDEAGGDASGYFEDDYEPENATPELTAKLRGELEALSVYSVDLTADFETAVNAYAEKLGEGWLYSFGVSTVMARNESGGGFWTDDVPIQVWQVLTDWAHSLGELHVFDDFVEENAAEWAGMFHAE